MILGLCTFHFITRFQEIVGISRHICNINERLEYKIYKYNIKSIYGILKYLTIFKNPSMKDSENSKNFANCIYI